MFMLKFSIIIIGHFVDNSFDIVSEIEMIFFFTFMMVYKLKLYTKLLSICVEKCSNKFCT
jgi:hypothetical protein